MENAMELFESFWLRQINFELQVIADELAESRTVDAFDALIFQEFLNQE